MTVNIHQVAENLRNTIKGKEAYLAKMREDIVKYNQTVNHTVAKFLELNIQELKVILYDVEQCAEQFSLMTWETNPERMGQ
jgi:hypothetical protein